MKYLPYLLTLLLPGLAPAAEPTAWEAAAVVNGAPYHKLEELRSFYKLNLNPKGARSGAVSIGNADVTLELGPGTRELSIDGLRITLARPLQRDATGEKLISREDWLCCIDPILRPTYIPEREEVKTIVIDPGHGGHDPGETTPRLREAELTLRLAQQLREALEKKGYRVVLTRSDDVFLSDQQRVEAAKAAGAGAIFLSLHVNLSNASMRGAAVYTLAPGAGERPGHTRLPAHAALAYALQSALVRQAGVADAGMHHVHYSLLSSIPCPAAWLELGCAPQEQEGAAPAAPATPESLVQALAQGIETYAHVSNPATRIPTQEPPPAPAKPAAPARKTTPPPAPPASTRSSAAATASSRSGAAKQTPTRKQQPTKQSTTPTKASTPAKATSTPKVTTPAKATTPTKPSTPAKATSTPKASSSATKAPTTKPQATKPQPSTTPPRRRSDPRRLL